MPSKRTGYAPWSLTREAGVQSATVDGTIEVPQYLQPVIDTGFVDEKGNWKGVKSSDEQFIGITTAEAIPNGAAVLFPDTPTHPMINMRGFHDMFIALKPTNGGNVAIKAVIGPDTQPFANLSPVKASGRLRGNGAWSTTNTAVGDIIIDGVESLSADVWNIFPLQDKLRGQRNMQFHLTNNTGGASDIIFGFMRVV